MVSNRLRDEVLEQAGRLRRSLVDKIRAGVDAAGVRTLRCKEMKLSMTCLALAPDENTLFSGSKDGAVAKCE